MHVVYSVLSANTITVFMSCVLSSFQYIFFFQVPVLPELLIGLRDFRALGSMFLGKAVSHVLCIPSVVQSRPPFHLLFVTMTSPVGMVVIENGGKIAVWLLKTSAHLLYIL